MTENWVRCRHCGQRFVFYGIVLRNDARLKWCSCSCLDAWKKLNGFVDIEFEGQARSLLRLMEKERHEAYGDTR